MVKLGMGNEILRKLFYAFSQLPFTTSARNTRVRQETITREVSRLLTDDERASFFGLPQGCRIREGAKILCHDRLILGKHCWIGENAILDASGSLEIGDHTSVGPSVFIWTHSSHIANLSFENGIGSNLIDRRPTRIGKGCFIAGPSVILPGVNVGDQVIVRPFSTVDRDVSNRSIFSPSGIRENVLTDRMIAGLRDQFSAKAEE